MNIKYCLTSRFYIKYCLASRFYDCKYLIKNVFECISFYYTIQVEKYPNTSKLYLSFLDINLVSYPILNLNVQKTLAYTYSMKISFDTSWFPPPPGPPPPENVLLLTSRHPIISKGRRVLRK